MSKSSIEREISLVFALLLGACSSTVLPDSDVAAADSDTVPFGMDASQSGDAVPIVERDCRDTLVTAADARWTAEYQALESGLCSGFCTRLRECGLLCEALSPVPVGCTNDAASAFDQCLHGGISNGIFSLGAC